jgi:hypothetical protein
MTAAIGARGTCRLCLASVIWAVTRHGEPVKLDPDPSADGTLVLEERLGQTPLVRPPDPLLDLHAPRYVAHSATCVRGR